MPPALPSELPPVRVERSIVFAHRPTGDLLLDLFLPASHEGPVPVVLWVHGGGWFTGDRTLSPDLAERVRATGMAMASIEYRLSGEALFPAQLHDVRAAIRFLRTIASRFGLDPRAIGVWGASAGGHLAALAGLTGHLEALPDEPEASGNVAVQAVVASYAPVDLAEVVAEAVAARPGTDGRDAPESRLIGGLPSELADMARQASPLHRVGPGAPPFQLSHGTGDVLVSHRQGERLHEALTAAGGSSELYLIDGYKHGFLNPAGRLDVELAGVMDDGRLAAEEPVHAVRHTSDHHAEHPAGQDATFGFPEIDHFFHRCFSFHPPLGDPR